MTEDTHVPDTEVALQAKQFSGCFEPNAYRLEQQFSWIDDDTRLRLARRVDEAIQEIFVEEYERMYGSDNG